MVTKSKLKLALAAEKGIDFRKIKEKRKTKAAVKQKKNKKASGAAAIDTPAESEEDDWEDSDEGDEDDEDDDEGGHSGFLDLEAEVSGSGSDEDDEQEDRINLGALGYSDESSDSEVEMEEKIIRPKKAPVIKQSKAQASKDNKKSRKSAAAKKGDDEELDEDVDEDEGEDEDEEDIPMSDLEDLPEDDKGDLIRHQRLTINNTTALLAALKRIALPTAGPGVAFSSHMCIVAAGEPTEAGIEDVQDDLARELALYRQSLEAARKARALLRAEGVPFTRPNDYFAEMVKPDEHMDRVKAKLVEDATAKKAAAEARKLRDLKKFGKQVQVAKLQERAKAKKDTLEKIKSLKRKRQESSSELPTHEADLFDVAVDNELKRHKSSAGGGKQAGRSDGAGQGRKRQKKNEKYGFGGKKRHSKSGDAASSGDLSGFSVKRMKGKVGGKAARPGKSKRQAMASRR